MLSREDLENRIKELETERQAYLNNAQTQMNMYEGAIQDCNYLLKSFDPKEEVVNEANG